MTFQNNTASKRGLVRYATLMSGLCGMFGEALSQTDQIVVIKYIGYNGNSVHRTCVSPNARMRSISNVKNLAVCHFHSKWKRNIINCVISGWQSIHALPNGFDLKKPLQVCYLDVLHCKTFVETLSQTAWVVVIEFVRCIQMLCY